MDVKQGLELRQTQKLSPLQIQTIKLIEKPIQELQQCIRKELEENPVLDDDPAPERWEDKDQNSDDEPRDVSIDEIKDDYIPSYNLRVNNWGKDERPEYNTFSYKESFTQGLEDQLGCRDLDPGLRDIAQFIIGSLDDDGYLRRDIESLVDDLAFRAGISATADEVLQALRIIQEFEPAGVGARDLRECLLLQLKSARNTPETENARKIIENCFDDFSNKHFKKILAKTGLSEKELKAATARILKLNPSPGGALDASYDDRAQQVVPDFVLTEENGEVSFVMPRMNIPELRVKKSYSDMLENSKGSSQREQKEAVTFVKQKIDSAKWFIEALKQRQNTLQKTMQAILDFQKDFFIDGDESSLRPMVLKDIAEKTGFDISTISRVVNKKYVDTHFGIFPLKYFFSEGLENKNGEAISTRELKKVLQECVDNEDKTHPLTDEQLVEEMGKRGYKVARRTIAKYRGQLGIPLARWRKQL